MAIIRTNVFLALIFCFHFYALISTSYKIYIGYFVCEAIDDGIVASKYQMLIIEH